MSYTARALSVCPSTASEVTDSCPPGSRSDFLQALRILSIRPLGNCRFEVNGIEIEAVQVAFLRCPLPVWLEVFGPPASVREHHESTPLFPVHVWVYSCSDGPLECVGYQVDDREGNRWVMFVRLCYF